MTPCSFCYQIPITYHGLLSPSTLGFENTSRTGPTFTYAAHKYLAYLLACLAAILFVSAAAFGSFI
jgi:hypothetical protein